MGSMSKEQKIVLLLLALAMFLVVLDSAIINLALPAIKSALHFTESSLQWVLTAYILTFGGFLMLGGRLADLYGRRKILIIGMTGFSVISLLIGLSPSAEALIGLRALQGIAGALMAPTALSILLASFNEGDERNKALSVWSIVASGGAAIGVFLGGLLTEYLGWQWCFFVNVPIGLLGVLAIMKYLPAHIQEERDKHLDLPGAILVTGGLMGVVYALTLAVQYGWTAPSTIWTLIGSFVLLGAFLFNETKSRHPLVPLSIFRIRNVSGANLVMLPVMAGALGMFYFTSLFVQNVLHYSPIVSGVSFLPIPIIIGILSYQAPKLLMKYGFKPLMVAGITSVTIGTFLMSFVNADSTYWANLFPSFLFLALGFGISFVSIAVAATTGVPGREAGLASGLMNTSQQVGGALGLAILAVVASSVIKADMSNGQGLTEASVHGYQQAFLWAAILMAVSLLVAIFVIHTPKNGNGAIAKNNH